MFTNLEKARAEVSCYTYCVRQVGKCIDRKDYTSASVYMENAARSLRELDKLKVGEENETVVLIGTIGFGRNNHD